MSEYLTHITLKLSSEKIVKPGWKIPRNNVISDIVPDKWFMLTPGKLEKNINKDNSKFLITGMSYIIGNKEYDLSYNYGVLAVMDKGMITPILRPAIGAEKLSQMQIIKEARKLPKREGELIDWWVQIKKI